MLKIAYHPLYCHPLPLGHRFPMGKYELIPEQLLYEGTITKENLFEPKPLELERILRTHDADYWNKLECLNLSRLEERRTGFPLSQRLVDREVVIARGTYEAALFAIKYGAAMNVAGGTHHALADAGEGFCLLNDIAVAANELLYEGLAKQILVVDLDVHQGNGTAKIMEKEPRVFTFSMHGATNFPHRKEKSDLDIPLPDKITDQDYLAILYKSLPDLIDRVKPDHVFYLSGVDILETDKLGKLSVSREGCAERDRFVLEEVKKRALPLTVSMGGGYSPKMADIVNAHCETFRMVQRVFF